MENDVSRIQCAPLRCCCCVVVFVHESNLNFHESILRFPHYR